MAAGPAPAGKLRTGGHRPAALNSQPGTLLFERVIAPDGSAIVPTSKPEADSTLLKALARAWRWQKLLDEGQFASVRDLAEAERVGLSYISRILRLNLLAPDIVERILDRRQAPQLAQLMQPFPSEWERQRERFCQV